MPCALLHDSHDQPASVHMSYSFNNRITTFGLILQRAYVVCYILLIVIVIIDDNADENGSWVLLQTIWYLSVKIKPSVNFSYTYHEP